MADTGSEWVKEFVENGGRSCRTWAVGGGRCGPKRPKKNSRILQKKLAGHPGCSQPTKIACQSREPIENGLGKSTAHVGWFWSQTPNFEPVELLVPLVRQAHTAAMACSLPKHHACKIWACRKGGPVGGQSPRHEAAASFGAVC